MSISRGLLPARMGYFRSVGGPKVECAGLGGSLTSAHFLSLRPGERRRACLREGAEGVCVGDAVYDLCVIRRIVEDRRLKL
jgi:hypothetical protein